MMSKVDEVEATCTTDGNIDYWLCNTCQLMFADDAGQQQLNEEDIVVRATGHAWDEVLEAKAVAGRTQSDRPRVGRGPDKAGQRACGRGVLSLI